MNIFDIIAVVLFGLIAAYNAYIGNDVLFVGHLILLLLVIRTAKAEEHDGTSE